MADNYQVKDANGSTISISADEVSSGVYSNRVILTISGVDVDNSAPLPVAADAALLAGEEFIGKVGGTIANPSANFTRPANTTAYALGDLIANSTTNTSVTPLSWTITRVAASSVMIRRVRLKKSGTSTTNASFRLHLYRTTPATITNGDNGAWSTSYSDYIGAFDVTCDRAFTDAAHGASGNPLNGTDICLKLSSGSTIYGLLEARAAYTPGNAEVFTVELEAVQN